MTKQQQEAIRAAVRVCMLTDGYISTLSPKARGALRSWGGGEMSFLEIREHLNAVRLELINQFKAQVPAITRERT